MNRSVHERFCMAAARADQVADTATTRQQATSLQPAAEDSRSSTVILHTPAPEQPQQASQGQTEAAPEEDESGPPGRGSAEQTEASSNSEQIEQSATSAADDSPDTVREEKGVSCMQDTAGAEARQTQISREESAGTEEALGDYKSRLSRVNSGLSAGTDQPHVVYESVSQTQTVSQSDMPASASDLGSVRLLRPPLAAVQEGSAPMLGSLSFKPSSMQRVHDEGTRNYHSFSVSPQLHFQAALHTCITAHQSMLVTPTVMLHADVADQHVITHQHSCILPSSIRQ